MPKSPEPKNFEQALSRLESIIAQMESDELPLDDLLVRYEEGMELGRLLLGKAEGRRKAHPDHYGKGREKPTLQEFDPASSKTAEPVASVPSSTATLEADDEEESDEIRLFSKNHPCVS
ncbi:MAG: exodeoxyribonuclease VII small subunit [Chthoniobacteraceae bacterium]